MIKARRKGNRNRHIVITHFQDNGYEVDVVEKTSRFAKQKDLFGLWDLIALKGTELIFIQVSTNTNHPHKVFWEWAKLHCSNKVRAVQVVVVDRKGLKFHWYM